MTSSPSAGVPASAKQGNGSRTGTESLPDEPPLPATCPPADPVTPAAPDEVPPLLEEVPPTPPTLPDELEALAAVPADMLPPVPAVDPLEPSPLHAVPRNGTAATTTKNRTEFRARDAIDAISKALLPHESRPQVDRLSSPLRHAAYDPRAFAVGSDFIWIRIITSAWIEFFRGREPVATRVDELLEGDEVALCGPVLTELRRGIRSTSERRKVLPLFDSCSLLPPPSALWDEAGDLGFLLSRKGATLKTLDLLIAVYALSHQVSLLTTDRDFALIPKAGLPLVLA
jgi:predicted nucleic acid-binding protein